MATTTRRMATAEPAHAMTDEEFEGLVVGGIDPTAPKPSVSGNPTVVTAQVDDQLGAYQMAVTRPTPGRVVMFSVEGVRKEIPVHDAKANYQSGYRLSCPKCGSRDCGGILGSCPAMGTPDWIECPVHGCGRRFIDRQLEDQETRERPALPGQRLELKAELTSYQRLLGPLRRHMEVRHPSEMERYGFKPVATPAEQSFQPAPMRN